MKLLLLLLCVAVCATDVLAKALDDPNELAQIKRRRAFDEDILQWQAQTYGILNNQACASLPMRVTESHRGTRGIGCYACESRNQCNEFCFYRTQCKGTAWTDRPRYSDGPHCMVYFTTRERDTLVYDSAWTLSAIEQRPPECSDAVYTPEDNREERDDQLDDRDRDDNRNDDRDDDRQDDRNDDRWENPYDADATEERDIRVRDLPTHPNCYQMRVSVTSSRRGTGGIGCYACHSRDSCIQFCFSRTQCLGTAWTDRRSSNGAQCIIYFSRRHRDDTVYNSDWTLTAINNRPRECL